MKHSLMLIAVFASLALDSSFAQQMRQPVIQWQQSVGGAAFDAPAVAVETVDGSFVFGGTSASGISGNKTSPYHDTNVWNGDYFQPNTGDYWLVKIDAGGQKLWDHSFGFGNLDQCWHLQQLPDGGFLLGGSSVSSNRIDPIIGATQEWDALLVRTDLDGNELWNHRLNDAGLDYPNATLPTPEGGSLVIGSGEVAWLDRDGNSIVRQLPNDLPVTFFSGGRRTADGGFILTGTHLRPLAFTNDTFIHGDWQIWIGRFDAEGSKLWEQTYGGALSEFGSDVLETPDGGFLIAGTSYSPPDEDKTSPFFDAPVPPSPVLTPGGDIWLVRIDANGQKLWEHSLGTASGDWPARFHLTSDRGIALLWSSISADWTRLETHMTRLDPIGNEIWSRASGTNAGFLQMVELPDGGFLLGGYAASEWRDEQGYPLNDGWLLRLAADGTSAWEMRLGGRGDDGVRTVARTKDGGFVVGLVSASGIDGNKTTPNYGDYDLWAVKLRPERPPDADNDGIADDHDNCPDTPQGTIVNARGCSIDQLAPCEGSWENHGQYVRAIVQATAQFREAGLITASEQQSILERAAKSDCGKPAPGKVRSF